MTYRASRIRDLGIVIGVLSPGKHNAITDVPGVQVGHLTVIQGEHGNSEPVIRTGVTLISPAPDFLETPRHAAIWALNGAGEVTGHHIIEELGRLDGVIAITGTLNVGAVLEGLQRWYFREQNNGVKAAFPFHIPTVAETLDARLTDIEAFPLKPEDILDIKLMDGPVPEGNVGGGTGMTTFNFKGGIGTSSRLLPKGPDGKQYTLGVIVQANHGRGRSFTIKGIPVGQKLWDEGWWDTELAQRVSFFDSVGKKKQLEDGDGSLIVIVATDAPLLPYQLKRLAKRVAIGAGRQGAMGEHFSGDIFLAFSTATPLSAAPEASPPHRAGPSKDRDDKYPMHTPFTLETVQTVVDETINTLFTATADATEEAILNALAAAETMTGVGGYVSREMPVERVKEILQEHGAV